MSITFSCTKCNQSINAEDNMSGKMAQCPNCGKDITVPKAKKYNLLNFLIVGTSIFLIISILLVILWTTSSLESMRVEFQVKFKEEHDLIVEKLKSIESVAQNKSSEIIRAAQEKADKISDSANKLSKMEEEKLHTIYPNLKKYSEGANLVNLKYIKSFQVSGHELIFVFENASSSRVKPDFYIVFLTKYGFVTMQRKVSWLYDSVNAGGTSADVVPIGRPDFGEPAYYFIVFNGND